MLGRFPVIVVEFASVFDHRPPTIIYANAAMCRLSEYSLVRRPFFYHPSFSFSLSLSLSFFCFVGAFLRASVYGMMNDGLGPGSIDRSAGHSTDCPARNPPQGLGAVHHPTVRLPT
jgi:hypothetical protein